MSEASCTISTDERAQLVIGALVNDEAILRANLASSSALVTGEADLIVERSAKSASLGLNRILGAHQGAEFIVLTHQDVYLPSGWECHLRAAIAEIECVDPSWAVLGLFGCAASGGHAGRVWSSGLGREVSGEISLPVAAQSIDELLIVLRVGSGVQFDEAMPGFHLYGTDIVQSAISRGMGAYIIDAPVVHNSTQVRSLDASYRKAYVFVQRKWSGRLPIENCVANIDRFGVGLRRSRIRLWKKRIKMGRTESLHAIDPAPLARQLGYESDEAPLSSDGKPHGA